MARKLNEGPRERSALAVLRYGKTIYGEEGTPEYHYTDEDGVEHWILVYDNGGISKFRVYTTDRGTTLVEEEGLRAANPAFRYAAIPVEPASGGSPAGYVVRMKSKAEATERVAQAVAPEDVLVLSEARTFDTKKEAQKYAEQRGWRNIEVLKKRLS